MVVENLAVEKLAVAIYDFEAYDDDMISMQERETFVVLEEDLDDNGWTVVKKRNGMEEGAVPTSYLEFM